MRNRTIGIVVILVMLATIPASKAQPIEFQWMCDIMENNPDTFMSDVMAHGLYFNNTSGELSPPPIENQIGSFDFEVWASHNSTKTVAIYTHSYPSPDSRFLGTPGHYVNHTSWLATNGIVHATSGPIPTMENISGSVESHMWNQSDWYSFRIFGNYYDPHHENHISWSKTYYFYMNVALTSPIPTQQNQEVIPSLLRGLIEIITIPLIIIREIMRYFL